mgnify:CR=1 FL=1
MTVIFLTTNGKKVSSQQVTAGLSSGTNSLSVLINDLSYVSDLVSAHFVALSPAGLATINGYSISPPNTVNLTVYTAQPTTATIELLTID